MFYIGRGGGSFFTTSLFSLTFSPITFIYATEPYAILRSIPNKLGGVLALVASILVLMVLPYIRTAHFKDPGFEQHAPDSSIYNILDRTL